MQTESKHQLTTGAVELILLSATMDGYERQDKATTENPGVFMQAYMVGNVHVKLEGRIDEIHTNLEPKLYNTCFYSENEK